MNVVGIIPARGGSVRVPKKNIALINKRPLIAYGIEAAQKSKFINKVVVSTDSVEIADAAKKYGAEVPFLRPANLAEDVPTEDVIIHAVNWLEENHNYKCDISVCLECDKPLRNSEHIDACVAKLLDDKYDSAITVHKIKSGRPEWYLRIKDNFAEPYSNYFKDKGKSIMRFPASQIFEDLYLPNGVVFASKYQTLNEYKSMVGERCYPCIIDEKDAKSINYPEDLKYFRNLMGD